ncbi:DNA methyltransferase [Leptospira santarosai]|uniref:DNA methyltransferase n=1 Tax=Leptospira santarosai TaxID=28183 RepID=UPI000518CAD0|nr:DNA methyltransferase [Leptospira santarosai]
MIVIKDIEKFEFDSVNVDPFWNIGNEKEHLMHRIHSYPAKFPAFIASKAFHFAKERNTKVRKVADIFCGCGTTAFEASKMGIEFWGCDINPVATMIAKAKSLSYQSNKIKSGSQNCLYF